MFSRIIKFFFIKRIIYKKLDQSSLLHTNSKISSIGLLVDETYFSNTVELIREICTFGIHQSHIEVVCFLDKKKKVSAEDMIYFTSEDVTWSGVIKNEKLQEFAAKPFDLLLSYYDIEKAPLLAMTFYSKATFKAGFQTVHKKANHLVINAVAENYKTYISELFKYLKIINKL